MIYSKYDVLDISEYILSYCEKELKTPINNQKLQKILYYAQGEYSIISDIPLFDSPIEAWRLGPVVPDAYYSYSRYSYKPICGKFPEKDVLTDKEKKLIRKVIDAKINISHWDLIDQTCSETPWINNYNELLKNEIPMDDIKKWFIDNRGDKSE